MASKKSLSDMLFGSGPSATFGGKLKTPSSSNPFSVNVPGTGGHCTVGVSGISTPAAVQPYTNVSGVQANFECRF